MNAQKVTLSVARISLGGFFLYSAWLKLFPIEPLEYTLIGQGIGSFITAPYLSRILISTEFLLGAFLILGIYLKYTYRFALLLLMIFSIYIAFIWMVFGSTENCGCMGEGVYMTPLESIVKNIFLTGIVLVLLKFKELSYSVKWKVNLFAILCLLISFLLPPILNPPDFYYAQLSGQKNIEYQIDTSSTNSFIINGKPLMLSKGEHIIAFLSLQCPHCKLAATKLTLIKKELGIEMPETVMLFLGNEDAVKPFIEESKAVTIPWYRIPEPGSFYKLAGNSFPVILYVKDGIVKRKWSLNELSPESIQKRSEKI